MNCAVCGEAITGGKGDWRHVGGYGAMRGPDGHLARPATENVPLYGEAGFSEGAEWRGKLASAFTHVAGTIGPFDPPGIKGQIRKGVISAVNAPATPFEEHKEHAEVVADRVICLAVIYDMVKELEQWRAAFGGTFEEVSERFQKGVEDDQ